MVELPILRKQIGIAMPIRTYLIGYYLMLLMTNSIKIEHGKNPNSTSSASTKGNMEGGTL